MDLFIFIYVQDQDCCTSTAQLMHVNTQVSLINIMHFRRNCLFNVFFLWLWNKKFFDLIITFLSEYQCKILLLILIKLSYIFQVYFHWHLHIWVTNKNHCKGLLLRRFYFSSRSVELAWFHCHYLCVSSCFLFFLGKRRAKRAWN